MASYTIDLKTTKFLDLFDDIPYKYVKNIIDDDDKPFDIEMEHLECNKIAWSNTKFTFKLSGTFVRGDSLPIIVEKTFEKVLYYNRSSPIGLVILVIEKREELESILNISSN